MIDIERWIEDLENSLKRLYMRLERIPAPLYNRKEVRETWDLINSVERKISLLKEEKKKFW